MAATITAVVYARQSVSEEGGIARQVTRSTALVKARKWRLGMVYRDNNTSATRSRGETTEWARMLVDIDVGRVDVVVAVNLDRLLRSIGDLHELLRRGVKVVTVEGDLDLTTDVGELQATVLAGVARFEVRRKSERAARAAIEQRAAGHPHAGRDRYGYRWLKENERDRASEIRLAIVEEEAAVVRKMFADALRRESLGSICRELNRKGVATRDGKLWRSTTVRRMLLNPFYAGLLPPRQTGQYDAAKVDLELCSVGSWEPLVSANSLRAVRASLMSASRTTNGGTTSRKWLLSGLARCATCGEPVRSAVTVRKSKEPKKEDRRVIERYRTYRCVQGHFMRRAEPLDAYVGLLVLQRLTQPDAAALLTPRASVDVAKLSARDARLVADSAQLLKWYREGRFTAAQVEVEQAKIAAERAEIGSTVSAALAADPVADLLSAPERVAERFGELSLHGRRRVVAAILDLSIKPIGKGRRAATPAEVEPTVMVRWQRGGHRAPIAVVSETGFELGVRSMPDESRKAIADLLA